MADSVESEIATNPVVKKTQRTCNDLMSGMCNSVYSVFSNQTLRYGIGAIIAVLVLYFIYKTYLVPKPKTATKSAASGTKARKTSLIDSVSNLFSNKSNQELETFNEEKELDNKIEENFDNNSIDLNNNEN